MADFKALRKKNIELTKKAIRDSVSDDILIIQSIRSIEDITKAIDMLVKRLREWYEYHNPEFSNSIDDHAKFTEIILEKSKDELLKDLGIDFTMGADFSDLDMKAMESFAVRIQTLYAEKKTQVEYIEAKMKEVCPNMLRLTGALIGAKLLEHAGSLKNMVGMPASTIQLLGAEKALFRHIKTGARCPKYGLLINHQLVCSQHQKLKGKAARAIADKISIAVKVDYYKGEYVGDFLAEKLGKKFNFNL